MLLVLSCCAVRAATTRLDFSALDREVVADQVNKQSQDREVRPASCRSDASLAGWLADTNKNCFGLQQQQQSQQRCWQHGQRHWQGLCWP